MSLEQLPGSGSICLHMSSPSSSSLRSGQSTDPRAPAQGNLEPEYLHLANEFPIGRLFLLYTTAFLYFFHMPKAFVFAETGVAWMLLRL